MWGAFAVQKLLTFFSAKNISTLDFRRTRRLNESLTNDFVKLTMLWTTGPRCPNVLNFYGIPQNLQLYGFLSACTTMWAFSVWGCVNVFPQVSHLNALCALWISMCRTIFAFWLKEREQYGQAYGRRPVWVNWCAFKWCSCGKIKTLWVLWRTTKNFVDQQSKGNHMDMG